MHFGFLKVDMTFWPVFTLTSCLFDLLTKMQSYIRARVHVRGYCVSTFMHVERFSVMAVVERITESSS